jgi:hypothetical protein
MHIRPRAEELEGLVDFFFSNVYTLAVVAPTLTIIVLLLLLFSRKFAFVEALLEVSMSQTHFFLHFSEMADANDGYYAVIRTSTFGCSIRIRARGPIPMAQWTGYSKILRWQSCRTKLETTIWLNVQHLVWLQA